MRVSYSQIDWFLRCPYLYKYQFIDNNRLPRGKSAVFGGILHAVMEYLYKEHPLFPTLSEALAFYERLWQERRAASFFPSELDARVHFTEGMRIIKGYYEKHGTSEPHILSLEKRFEVPLEDPQTGQVHVIAGQIDRIDKTPRTLEIIDYKTGRELKSEKQVATDFQLGIYHMALDALWPEMMKEYEGNVVVSLYFLRHHEKVSTKKSSEEIRETKQVLLDHIRAIEKASKEGTFDPMPSSLCQIEPYNRVCPYFKDRFRTEKPKLQDSIAVEAAIREYVDLKNREQENKKRLAALNEMVHGYMDAEGLEGIFDGNIGISRSKIPLYKFDTKALRDLLDPLGKWEDILEVSKSKVKSIKKELPESVQKRIEEAQTVKSVSRVLRVKKLKG